MLVAMATQRCTSAEQDQSPSHCVWGPSTLVLTSGFPWTGPAPSLGVLGPVWSWPVGCGILVNSFSPSEICFGLNLCNIKPCLPRLG